jgi:hypothetical protein
LKSFSATLLASLNLYGFLIHPMWSDFLCFLTRVSWFQHLEQVIRQKIPSIIALINKTIDELNAELDRIGRPIAVDSGVSNEIYDDIIFLRFEITQISTFTIILSCATYLCRPNCTLF